MTPILISCILAAAGPPTDAPSKPPRTPFEHKAIGYSVAGTVGLVGAAILGPVRVVPGEKTSGLARPQYPLNYTAGFLLIGSGVSLMAAGMAETGVVIRQTLHPASDPFDHYQRHMRRSTIGWSVSAGATAVAGGVLLGLAGNVQPRDAYSQETAVGKQRLYTLSMLSFGLAAGATSAAIAYGVGGLRHRKADRACWPTCGSAVSWTPVTPGTLRF